MLSLLSYYLHPNEYSEELHYYQFAVKLDRCVGSCNTLMIYQIKNLSVFNMITKINESKTYHADVNVDVSVRNAMYMNKIMFGILLRVAVKMENI